MNPNYYQSKNIVITAGPTYEKIDPVRFIGNYSSGKMGYAIAKRLCESGANVTLISGPTNLESPDKNIHLIRVESALEMFEEVKKVFNNCEIAIMAAAVADYRPAEFSKLKIKKNEDSFAIQLVKNPDILSYLGDVKTKNQLTIGFALENFNELENAKKKLINKNADAIVLNSLNNIGAGFQHDTNQIKIMLKNGLIFEFELKNKELVAQDIIECIADNL